MSAGADSTLSPGESVGLTLADFDGLTGTSFSIKTEFGGQQLVLAVAQGVPGATRPEGGFRLEFHGPAEPRLPQATYIFRVRGADREIFIVPIGMTTDRRLRYEAVFF